MAGNLIKNKFVKPSSGVNFSRSLFRYEKRHSTNMLAGYIVPVHTQFLYPGSSPDWNFGCVVESAPLISTCLDNIYIDIVSIWCPMRLVMKDWNEFLGESHSTAFTINRSIKIPKVSTVFVSDVSNLGLPGTGTVSRAYFAARFLAPHIGYRLHTDTTFASDTHINDDSKFKNGVSVIPSRIYELNWNTFFRNENVQNPILLDLTSTFGTHDADYYEGLGKLLKAHQLKTFYYNATPSPSLLDVSIAMDQYLAPVGYLPQANGTLGSNASAILPSSTSIVANEFKQLRVSDGGVSGSGNSLVTDLSALTVNRMYYALMEQRFANKMMKGRRAVEFYENFFGVKGSEAGHDLPQLLTHKRYPINISQVIATASGTNGTETSDLGQRGAFSNTGFGGPLVHNFTATEHGYIQTYAIIRGQPSIYQGIDHHLGSDSLLDFYLPEFDHIGPVGIERLELNDQGTYSTLNYGYTNAWYAERNQVSDVAGIIEPGQPLSYKTLAREVGPSVGTSYLYQYKDIDHIFMFPVAYGTPLATGFDSDGAAYNENRYQFLIQFAVKGKLAAVMSPDSEPLKMRI